MMLDQVPHFLLQSSMPLSVYFFKRQLIREEHDVH